MGAIGPEGGLVGADPAREMAVPTAMRVALS
jgi:hypothetical protein